MVTVWCSLCACDCNGENLAHKKHQQILEGYQPDSEGVPSLHNGINRFRSNRFRSNRFRSNSNGSPWPTRSIRITARDNLQPGSRELCDSTAWVSL